MKTICTAIASANASDTLKGSKEALETVRKPAAAHGALFALLLEALECKTKLAFAAALEAIEVKAKSIQVEINGEKAKRKEAADLKKAEETAEIETAMLGGVTPSDLPGIATAIHLSLDDAARAYMETGRLLTVAKTFHESSAKFIDWTEAQFNLKKAQAYKLMKVWSEFGGIPEFNGCAMRALYLIAGVKEAAKNETIEAAKELALASSLDTATTTALIQLMTGFNKEQQTAFVELLKTEDGLTTEKAKVLIAQHTPEPAPAGKTPAPASGPAADKTGTDPAPFDMGTDDQQDILQELAQTRDKLAALEAVPAPVIPMLRQFKSGLPTLVLGFDLSEIISEKEVRGSYRELVAVFNESTNKAAFDAITAARDALLDGFARSHDATIITGIEEPVAVNA
jgi:sulfur carrier protein ThiS